MKNINDVVNPWKSQVLEENPLISEACRKHAVQRHVIFHKGWQRLFCCHHLLFPSRFALACAILSHFDLRCLWNSQSFELFTFDKHPKILYFHFVYKYETISRQNNFFLLSLPAGHFKRVFISAILSIHCCNDYWLCLGLSGWFRRNLRTVSCIRNRHIWNTFQIPPTKSHISPWPMHIRRTTVNKQKFRIRSVSHVTT